MSNKIKVAELFAGVGGFRLGLEGYDDPRYPQFHMDPSGPFETIWANQWEPQGSDARQFAARCYRDRFPTPELVNQDISVVLDEASSGARAIPDIDMVVGGFPCQDYSVARPLSQASGIEGKKGVLWWEICRFLELKHPRFALFENVDRLLKSPAKQRGRDFAIILSCLASYGYTVEWRVVNSSAYGYPQRRKRVYIFCELDAEKRDLHELLFEGVMSEAFPAVWDEEESSFSLASDPFDNSEHFGRGFKTSPFRSGGVMQDGHVLTANFTEKYDGDSKTLGDVLVPLSEVPEEYFIDEQQLSRWEYLKGAKKEERVNKSTGFAYHYSEGAMAFPDPLDRPSRTILTGEGGRGASRFKHVIQLPDGRYRRLVPDELDQLQGFPKGWTNTGMTDGQRAFCMGNALVTGIPHRIGKAMNAHYQLG